MRQKKHPFIFFIIFLLSLVLVAYLVFSYPPSSVFHIASFSIPLLPFVMGIFGICIGSFATYLTRSAVHGALIALLLLSYLLLRYVGLTSWYFLFIVVLIFITLELFFFKRK